MCILCDVRHIIKFLKIIRALLSCYVPCSSWNSQNFLWNLHILQMHQAVVKKNFHDRCSCMIPLEEQVNKPC